MQQLIQIENVPIKLEMKSTRATFQRSEVPAADFHSPVQKSSGQDFSAKRSSGVSSVRNAYPAVDEYVSMKAAMYGSVTQSAAVGGNASYDQQAASELVYAGIQNVQMNAAAMGVVAQGVYDAGRAEIYENDRSNFEIGASLKASEFEFVPGSIEFTMTQRQEVNFEYLGKPIYVPKSADPNYVDVYA